MSNTDPQRIEEVARLLVGTPYHHQGRLAGVGLDCVGVLITIASRLGYRCHDLYGYARYPDGQTLLDQLSKSTTPAPEGDQSVGNIVIFWITQPGLATHVGVRTSTGFVHANARLGKVVEHSWNDAWRSRVMVELRFCPEES